MTKKASIAGRADQLCRSLIEDRGYDLLETVFLKEDEQWFLRFFIDKRGGISMDDCETVSRLIDPLIDEELNLTQSYNLEVSSPGLDRPLKTRRDLLRYLDEEVEVSLYKARDGKKKIIGRIVGMSEDDVLELETDSGETESFTKAERATVKRVIRF